MHRTREPSPGFTLIELMVALLVLLTLAAIAVPSFRDFFERGKVRGAAEDLVSTISQARAEAVKRDIDVSIAFAGGGTSWCMGGMSPNPPTGGARAAAAQACNCDDDTPIACTIGGEPYKVLSSTHPEIAISGLPGTMIFDSNLGTLSNLAAPEVTLTSPTGKYDVRVEVNALGQARACTPDGKPTMSSLPACAP